MRVRFDNGRHPLIHLPNRLMPHTQPLTAQTAGAPAFPTAHGNGNGGDAGMDATTVPLSAIVTTLDRCVSSMYAHAYGALF
jgi:hypothetical protein